MAQYHAPFLGLLFVCRWGPLRVGVRTFQDFIITLYVLFCKFFAKTCQLSVTYSSWESFLCWFLASFLPSIWLCHSPLDVWLPWSVEIEMTLTSVFFQADLLYPIPSWFLQAVAGLHLYLYLYPADCINTSYCLPHFPSTWCDLLAVSSLTKTRGTPHGYSRLFTTIEPGRLTAFYRK